MRDPTWHRSRRGPSTVGDHFIVNGQKVWTSYADEADWIFCLVRTDSARKQAGISFLLFDMRTPGVTARPTLLISGKSPFCETFFDNVKVPAGNLVGELNGGWTIAKYLLTHEREMISSIGSASTEKSAGATRRRVGRRRCAGPPAGPEPARPARELRGR